MNPANPWNADVPFSYSSMWLGSAECLRVVQRKTSHDETLHWLRYSIREYFKPALDDSAARKPRDEYRCLILGANEGWMERLLCQSGFKGRIIASDIASKALARAEQRAREEGYPNVQYVVADLNKDRFEGPFDFIIAEGVLHHIANIEPCLRTLAESLTPDGYLFAAEFEGPVRFQLSALQTRWINAALAVLPKVLRPLPPGDEPLFPATPQQNASIQYAPPSEQSIAAFDPSEAICGPTLKRLIPQVFQIVERNPFGGTLLSYMTAHFDFARANSDEFSRQWLKLLIHLEDTLIKTGILQDEFVFYVLKRKA
ncbi:MAG: class I SAM-dependent methyltransferase [Tepidisphaeraceae bacterium]|jgi:2-polyprenyl-3-methyl-5-hydroxy-6-metoxy-1,4-benzoquinol methylase